jgi:hypothetical protein
LDEWNYAWQYCLHGPQQPFQVGCTFWNIDFDGDDDIDLRDLARLGLIDHGD